ncbi:DegT/DnrJ/EryC1/StrS family aminotransferase [Candidatus Woesearchaeota archaeon]|nr:DegT/DnrJ/EryC1/StrS family aminotransferase [Candidatus Woesearchaeota archaeon]
MEWKIPLFRINNEETDIKAVTDIIRRGSYWTTGPEIKEFESKIAEYVGKKYALTFNSGTSALHTLLLAHSVSGGEIIVPSFTFISTANAVVLAGARPVFAESEPDTLGLDVKDVKKRITPKTKAVIAIDYGGCICRDIDRLRELCREKNIQLIEDAAESFGSTAKDRMAGSLSDSAIFSFCQNKIITTGEGGAAVTDSKEIYEKMKLIRSHGRIENDQGYFSNPEDSDYIDIGYNYRMCSITASIGLSQINRVDKIIMERRSIAKEYNEAFSKIKEIKTPSEPPGFKHVYQMYSILINKKTKRDALKKHLEKNGVMVKVYFNPVHLKTYYMKRFNYHIGDLPFTEDISNRVLSLPIYPGIKKEDLKFIINIINDFFRKSTR